MSEKEEDPMEKITGHLSTLVLISFFLGFGLPGLGSFFSNPIPWSPNSGIQLLKGLELPFYINTTADSKEGLPASSQPVHLRRTFKNSV